MVIIGEQPFSANKEKIFCDIAGDEKAGGFSNHDLVI
jgi:hypothetical protein